jgi:hypothetical protein
LFTRKIKEVLGEVPGTDFRALLARATPIKRARFIHFMCLPKSTNVLLIKRLYNFSCFYLNLKINFLDPNLDQTPSNYDNYKSAQKRQFFR